MDRSLPLQQLILVMNEFVEQGYLRSDSRNSRRLFESVLGYSEDEANLVRRTARIRRLFLLQDVPEERLADTRDGK